MQIILRARRFVVQYEKFYHLEKKEEDKKRVTETASLDWIYILIISTSQSLLSMPVIIKI